MSTIVCIHPLPGVVGGTMCTRVGESRGSGRQVPPLFVTVIGGDKSPTLA